MNSLHHIEINVSNLNKSLIFYEWLFSYLDYSLFQKWEFGFSFKKESSYIVFVQTDKTYLDAHYHRKQIGLNHIAFLVSFVLIDKIHKAALNKSISLLYEDRYPHPDGDHHALFLEDPDRIKIELRDK